MVSVEYGRTGGYMDLKDNSSYKRRVYTIVLTCFVIMFILLFYANETMKSDYFDAIGRRAMTFCMVMADQLSLTDQDVAVLIDMDFDALLSSSINSTFENESRKYMPASEIKYVYVLHSLTPDKIKYNVESNETDYYGLDEGSPLDTVYLIDAVINDDTRLEDTDFEGYTDKDRYTVMPPDILAIYDSREAMYQFYTDEWGTYISGFAPLYSVEGTYIGLLAADVFVDEYILLLRRRSVFFILFSLLIVILITLNISGFRRLSKTETVLEQLRALAYLDDMTGFYNRRTFNEQAYVYSKLIRSRSDTVSVTMIDIDHFKEFNDKYGHPKGDEVLIRISNLIRDSLDATDYAFRYGGDEFMILSVNKNEFEVHATSKEILSNASELAIDGIEDKVTLSIGIATERPNRQFDIYELITLADDMLYESKDKGRNSVSATGTTI